jgi:hypothetical protein
MLGTMAHIHVIPATWEVETRGMVVKDHPEQKVSETLQLSKLDRHGNSYLLSHLCGMFYIGES